MTPRFISTPKTPVVIVTGGGAGIGAAIAEALGRAGAFVVTVDANVTLDGSAAERADGPSTAERIVAAGGAARAFDESVTDGAALVSLFKDVARVHGPLHAVVNAAGISRPTSFSAGDPADWEAVLSVHLGGYLHVLRAALTVMEPQGRGTVVGLTSGSGWRMADAGAYGCAKRAVAALTWQVAAAAPEGVTVTALSPIAATRMVAAGLARAGADPSARTGGITLAGFPEPARLGPVGVHLAAGGAHLHGRIFFSAGAELALVGPPRLLEVVRSRPVADLPAVLDEVVPALGAAEVTQATGGGTAARFTDLFDHPIARPVPADANCLVVGVSARSDALARALTDRGARCRIVSTVPTTAGEVGDLVGSHSEDLDAVVVWLGSGGAVANGTAWRAVLDAHRSLPQALATDAAWARAAAATGRPLRLVVLVEATDAAGRSRAQALTQLSRAARAATAGAVDACVVGVESTDADDLRAAAELAASLAVGSSSDTVSGAELCVGHGWVGVRSHPTVAGTVTFGGPDVPDWVASAVAELTSTGQG